ncbi:MAG TPA: hypothetical protein VJT50_09625 [Pyrinomonadaceae bacterium]|nr:hypothetical protein [Pyrinomonadaceae bacterium]
MKHAKFFSIVMLLFAATAIEISAQSQDRDNPTPLAANSIKGNGIGKKVEYYYGFSAGPGEIVITVDLKAKSGSTNADVEIFDAEASKIFYYYPNATTQNERAVKKITLNDKQTLTLRIALDSSAGEYAIKLAGAVDLAAAPTADPTASVITPDPTGTTPPADAAAQPPTETPAVDASVVPTPDTSVAKPGKGSKFDLGVNLLQTVGTHFGLPTSGMLHIIMKDGTTQDVDLSKVKSASVTKQ